MFLEGGRGGEGWRKGRKGEARSCSTEAVGGTGEEIFEVEGSQRLETSVSNEDNYSVYIVFLDWKLG